MSLGGLSTLSLDGNKLFGGPLSSDKFRLIQIDLGWSSQDAKVRCRLTVEHLSHAPKYLALSYRWDDKYNNEPIICNGREIYVSRNLASALRVLRDSDMRHNLFWIDQICINQECPIERRLQVQIMKDIFRNSSRTVIWLGISGSYYANRAFGLLEQINKISAAELIRAERSGRKELDKETLTPGLNLKRGLPILHSSSAEWSDLAHLLYKSWFIRIWVVQEAVLSQQDPLIIWGKHTYSFKQFGEAISWLQLKGYGVWQNPRLPLRRCQTLIELKASSKLWSLEALLQRTRRFNATDPRDFIFGLLGLAAETQDPESWPRELIPDYSKSTKDVFRDAARFVIQRTQKLTILSAAENSMAERDIPTDIAAFPSWVPKWDYIDTRTHLCISCISYVPDEQNIIQLHDTINNASKGLPVELDESAPLDVLRLQGIKWDIIKRHSNSFKFDDRIDNPYKKQLKTQIPALWRAAKTFYSDEDAAASAFFQTTVAGRISTPDGTTSAASEPLSHFWAYINDILFPPSTNDPNTESSYTEIEKVQCGDAMRYMQNMLVCNFRRLFFTERGFMGLGPRRLLKGDVVVVLLGGSVPFVLRPKGSGYVLLGEAYVHGIMGGEAVEAWRKGFAMEWIELV